MDEHARAEAPNEACGLVAFRDGVAERYLPGRNHLESPYRFELEPASPEDWFLEDDGFELAVFHSHPSSAPRPSRTDIANIGLWAGRLYLILSLATGELGDRSGQAKPGRSFIQGGTRRFPLVTPSYAGQALTAWRIQNGRAEEVPLS